MEWRTEGQSRFQGRAITIDPLADWLLGDAGAPIAATVPSPDDLTPDLSLRVLIRLAEGVTAADLATFAVNGVRPADDAIVFGDVKAATWRSSILIASTYRQAKGHWAGARYCTARIAPQVVNWLADHDVLASFIDSLTISVPPEPLVIRAAGTPLAMQATPRIAAGSVLMGLIDDGLCLASDRFRSANGQTRSVGLWSQQFTAASRPPGFDYGRLITRREVNTALGSSGGDEDAFYRIIGLYDAGLPQTTWSAARTTHGTHVMDIAAGAAPEGDVAGSDLRPIVSVQLPDVAVDDGSGHSLGYYLLDGLRFIAAMAERMAEGTDGPPNPVVVTVSYGNMAGPHDGSSDIERAMDDLVRVWSVAYPSVPFVIVMPSGNSYLADCHAALPADGFERDFPQSLTWEILPDDGTPNLLQVWLPDGFDGVFSLQVSTPTGQTVALSTKGTSFAELRDDKGRLVAQAISCPPSKARSRHLFQICVTRTAPDDVGGPVAPHGRWRLTAAASGMQTGTHVHAWVQRDDLPRRTVRNARQSRFVDPCGGMRDRRVPNEGAEHRCLVDGAGSLNAMASGSSVVVVAGAFVRTDMAGGVPDIAPYSGAGFKGEENRGVDLAAPSEESVVLAGIRAGGARSRSSVRLNGTSVAAPFVARRIADRIESFRQASPKSAAGGLVSTFARPSKSDERQGWGIIRPAATDDDNSDRHPLRF